MKEIFVTINGVGMTKAEYETYRKSKNAENGVAPKKKARRRKATTINLLESLVKKTMKTTNIVKSLTNFIDNGKKEFGHATEYILTQHPTLHPRFSVLRLKIRELESKANEVQMYARKNEAEVYQYIENLSYRLDNLRLEFDKCVEAIRESGILIDFRNERCIYETGRRLGLNEIVRRSNKAIPQMVQMYNELQEIAMTHGTDVSVYDPFTGRRVK